MGTSCKLDKWMKVRNIHVGNGKLDKWRWACSAQRGDDLTWHAATGALCKHQKGCPSKNVPSVRSRQSREANKNVGNDKPMHEQTTKETSHSVLASISQGVANRNTLPSEFIWCQNRGPSANVVRGTTRLCVRPLMAKRHVAGAARSKGVRC